MKSIRYTIWCSGEVINEIRPKLSDLNIPDKVHTFLSYVVHAYDNRKPDDESVFFLELPAAPSEEIQLMASYECAMKENEKVKDFWRQFLGKKEKLNIFVPKEKTPV